LREFFNKDPNNSIIFWDCPSDNKGHSHHLVDKESKSHKIKPLLPRKISWVYSRKDECDFIIKTDKCISKHLTSKKKTFWNVIITTNPLIPLVPKTDYGFVRKSSQHCNLVKVLGTF